ncbi:MULTISPECIES: hypothetical protein [unclassified Streptomyces]|uniref:hypothetical protein n=1 Tax=unclassified Streptomyces TaxID=2593676 RepID=UPI0007F33802|nr:MULTISPECIES: hypothetical protein [unclassified Streptomyces]MCM1973855.1 hypothetical protein [Streptomyces sp. G1]SBT91506.1 hypothetical protein GA0115233_103125 [Streptomyces sp. DI166]
MDSETRACPACGQSVETVVRRHKTLGAWVPRWVPGPCHNPDCEAYVEEGAEEEPHPHHRTHHHHPQPSPVRSVSPERPESPQRPAGPDGSEGPEQAEQPAAKNS